MSWIETIRSKPQREKIKIIWIICGLVILTLIIVWVVVGGYKKDTPKDLRFFQTLGKSLKNTGASFKEVSKQPNPYK